MIEINNILLNRSFNYKTASVEDIFLGDEYTKIETANIIEVYVAEAPVGTGLSEKYDLLKLFGGYVDMKSGVCYEVDKAKIKSILLREDYLLNSNNITRQKIEREFGKADYELTDGTMWVFEYVVDSKILVYKKLKLYFYVDPETHRVNEIRFGDVNEDFYD
jgi:hypothetical protein